MHSLACSLPEPGKIKVFIRRIFFADDFQKLEGPCMLPCPFTRTQCAERLADCSLLVAARYGDDRARRVNAEGSRKVDFLLCRRPGRVNIRGTEVRDQLRREHVHDGSTISFTRFNNLYRVERPSDASPKKPARNAAACLAAQVRRLV